MARVEIDEEEVLNFWDIARVKMKGQRITRDLVPGLAWKTYLEGEAKFTVSHRVYWEMAR
jgi:hypothetical protein